MSGHELLLALAGRIPDKVLAQARRLLAYGSADAAVTLLVDLLVVMPIPLTLAELAAIRTLSGDQAALPGTQPVAGLPAPPFVFGLYDKSGAVGRDGLDEALVAAAETCGTRPSGIWRTWRYPQLGSPAASQVRTGDSPADASSAYRVYLIQVSSPAIIPVVAAGVLHAIPDSADAGIEIFAVDEEPPPYQRAALSGSLLLWAVVAEPEFQVARVFDFADPVTGPGFAPDHHVIEDPAEIARLGDYLRGGYPALTTTTTMTDVIDPAPGAVVPASFRTDGSWIWTDSVAYYLDRYGMAPDPRLTEHIEARVAAGAAVPDVDAEAAISAANFLLYPPETQKQTAVWFPSGDS